MKIIFNFFAQDKIFFAIVTIWVLAQLLLACFAWNPDWISDSGLYQYYASQSVKNGVIYPSYENYYDEFIFAPGWVNCLALLYWLTGSFRIVPFFLIIINILNLVFLLKICKKMTNSVYIYYTFGYIYISSGVNLYSHLLPYSEYLFVLLTSIALYLCFTNKTWHYFSCGILMSLAIWLRPLAYAWVIAILFFGLLYHKSVKNCIFFILTTGFVCMVIAFCTHQNFPDYMFQASTGGVNMIMGADDTATGGYNPIPRQKGGSAYIPQKIFEDDSIPVMSGVTKRYVKKVKYAYSYKQIDSIYTSKSIVWIKAHPVKWVILFYPKLKILLLQGSHFFYPDWISSKLFLRVIAILNFWQACVLRICCLCVLIGLFFKLNKKEILILMPVVLSIGMTIICVSHPRYNYVFLSLLMLFALISLEKLYYRIKDNYSVLNR